MKNRSTAKFTVSHTILSRCKATARGINMITSPYRTPEITPAVGVHPRLMFSAADIERIKSNIKKNPKVSSMYRELSAAEPGKVGATPEYGSYNMKDCLAAEARALSCCLNPDPDKAKQLIRDIRDMLEGFTVTNGIMGARWGGHIIFTAAEVFDWCYDCLTDEDKAAIIKASEEIAKKYFEMRYPPSHQMAISGHGGEAQLLRDLLAFSIAVYDERPDIYEFCAGRIFDEYVPEYNKLFAAGASPQGPSYGAYRYTCMLWSELLLRPFLKKTLYSSTEPMADGFYYFRLPNGQATPLGDNFYATKSKHTREHPFAVPMFLAYCATGRADFLKEADGIEGYLIPDKHGYDYYADGAWGEGLISPTSFLIFDGMTDAKQTQNEKELCHYFGEPLGMTVIKAQESYILMKLGSYWGSNHDHFDTGSFQIWYKGALTGESGIYDSYGAAHRKNYLIRTVAHNCLTVKTDSVPEGFPENTPNDGGTRRPCDGKEPKAYNALCEHYKMATTLSHSEAENEISLVGDLTDAYRHSCEEVIRSMKYLPNEKKLIVSDKVTAKDAEYRKEFLIHCEVEPELKGNTIIIRNDHASLICTVKEPQNATVTAIGGDEHRFFNDGIDYPPDEVYDDKELGWGRVVISPGEASKTDRFVVEMKIEALS